MDVILLERVEKLGQIGDVVSVKAGFARNYLLPRKKALRANEANKKVFEANRERIVAENAARRETRGERLEGHRRQDRDADPSVVERRPALRIGLRPRSRRDPRGRRHQGDQEPDRARPSDQDAGPARGEDRAAPGSVGDDQGQRCPFAGRGRAAGAGRRRDGFTEDYDPNAEPGEIVTDAPVEEQSEA
jgi:large subunit ribosomal protein L9